MSDYIEKYICLSQSRVTHFKTWHENVMFLFMQEYVRIAEKHS